MNGLRRVSRPRRLLRFCVLQSTVVFFAMARLGFLNDTFQLYIITYSGAISTGSTLRVDASRVKYDPKAGEDGLSIARNLVWP